jgi:hypothetical protein
MSENAANAEPASPDGDAGPAQTTINSQVLVTIRALNESLVGKDDATAAGAIAYQHVAHAAALAIQDAVDYQRNTLSICAAAQGKAYAMMLADPARAEQWAMVCALAMSGSLAAGATMAEIGAAARLVLSNFPRT